MSRQPDPNRGGFTLIEIIIAMGMLVLGMSGIFALFSTALSLQKEATERMDVAIHLPGVLARVQEDLSERAAGKSGSALRALDGSEFEVPGNPAYRYRVTLEAIPGDFSARGYFCRIVIVARAKGQDRLYDMGYRPIVPEPDNDARIRKLLGR